MQDSNDTPFVTADIESVVALIEEAAGAVVMTQPEDREALGALEQIFEKLTVQAPQSLLRGFACDAVSVLDQVLREGGDAGAALNRVGGIVTVMQRSAATFLATAMATPTSRTPQHPEPAEPASPPRRRASAPRARSPEHVERDAEIVELLGDFLQEAEEGVDQVDALLIEIEQTGGGPERINALFRVFHSIKGVAASLDVGDVTRLAHATETLLDQARSGAAPLSGERIERVFEAAALMRRLLGSVRRSVERSVAFASLPEVDPMIDRIGAFLVSKPAAIKPKPHPTTSAATVRSMKGSLPARSRRAPPSLLRGPPVRIAVHPEEPAPTGVPLPTQPSDIQIVMPPAPTNGSRDAATAPVVSIRSKKRAAAAVAESPTGKLRETVKVDLDRVDSIVEMIGELIIVESMVVNAPEIAALSSLRVRNYLSQLTKISRDLQNIAMRMRMVPVQGVFQKMGRMVRDLGRKTGKNVVLVPSGETAEMDRSMVERIEDPLVHMIRNAVDHGVETVAERLAAGKLSAATIRLSAYHEGGSIVIEIADDGRGLCREGILRKARERGLLREGDNPSDAEVYGLIFLPGFSTAAKVTEISGRGVGMDVVKRNIESMRGRVTVSSTPGQGTTFRLILPLTLAIIDGMLVACGAERYIVPSLAIIESLKPTASMVHSFADRGELINVRGEMLPLVRLQRLFGIDGEERAPADALAVVLETMGKKIGLLVDDVLTQQQVVIKALGEGLGDTELLAGAAILSDGRVGLILNVDRIGSAVTGGGILHVNRSVATEEAA